MVHQQLREQCHADQRQLTMAAEIGQQLLAENTEVKSQIECLSDKVDRANESKKQLEEELRTSTKNTAETQERYQKVDPFYFQYKTFLNIRAPSGAPF
jgi:predicted nuclease with TOPRIM domain